MRLSVQATVPQKKKKKERERWSNKKGDYKKESRKWTRLQDGVETT
jgi:hypothetical protein